MADIQAISAIIFTSEAEDAGTDGDVYLGIGGREFYLDTPQDDFEPTGGYTPELGVGATVSYPELNDPRSPSVLRTQQLDSYPVYLRLDGTDHWKVLLGAVYVYSGPDAASMQATDFYYTPIRYTGMDGGLWLGPRAGKCLHLRRTTAPILGRVLREAGLLEMVTKVLSRKRPPSRSKKKTSKPVRSRKKASKSVRSK